MNNKLEQCINRVQDEIKTNETSLADTGNHLTTAVEQKAESLEAGWKNALAKCDAKREEAGQAGQRLRQFLEEKKDEFACEPRGPGTNKHLFGTGANGENGEEASASVSFRLRGAPQRRFGATAAVSSCSTPRTPRPANSRSKVGLRNLKPPHHHVS